MNTMYKEKKRKEKKRNKSSYSPWVLRKEIKLSHTFDWDFIL